MILAVRLASITLQAIFVSKKLEGDLKPEEIKPNILSRQCVVYKCELCDADYVGYTARHLHQRIAEHKYSSIGKQLLETHGDGDAHEKFNFLKIEDLRSVNTSQKNFQTSLPNFPLDECKM